MILDRVVEGGLDGVENLSPSRELLQLLVSRYQTLSDGANVVQGWWTLRVLYWKKIRRVVGSHPCWCSKKDKVDVYLVPEPTRGIVHLNVL